MREVNKSDSELQICDICQPEKYTGIESLTREYTPEITYFGVSENVLHIAEQLKVFQESDVYMKLLNTYKGKVKLSQLTAENVADNIFTPAHEELKSLVDNLKSGTITLIHTRKYFGAYKDQYSKLEDEIRKLCRIMNEEHSWIKKRCLQVEQCFVLSQYQTGAKLMQKFVDQFNLTGDFSKLKLLLSEASMINILLYIYFDSFHHVVIIFIHYFDYTGSI